MSSYIGSICLHHRIRSLCLVVALAFFASMGISHAQVTIKERVEIGGTGLPNVTGHNVLSAGEAIWVAPAPGFWKLRVTTVWQALSPISSSAYFQVTTPEATYAGNVVEWASHQDNQWVTFSDYCTGRDTLGWYYGIGGVIPYDRTLAIHVASAGDTLRFRYNSDFGVSDFAEIYQDPYPEWVIRLGLDHPCIRREAFTPPPDLCQLHLSYIYDTSYTRFAVETLKDTLAYGDSLEFHVVAMNEFNQETPLAGDTPLTLRISPSAYGHFITQTADTPPSPLSNVPYQDAREGRIRFVADGTTPDSLQPVAIEAVQMSDTTKRGSDTVYVKPSVIKILLGETKYYRAEEVGGTLKIKEYASVPPQGALTGVNWDVDTVMGRRLSVYYEDRDSTGAILEGTDRIRLIGRYWTPDTTYKVRLTTTQSGRSDTVLITVNRPDSLGRMHTITRDVFDNIVNVDSICILHGGQYGIPPQLIKGQMREEAPPTDFGAFEGFTPAYRYEPLTHQFFFQDIPEWVGNQAYVNDAGMGTVPIPEHQHVRDIPYPTERHRVWWYLEQHSDLVTPSPQIRMYGRREADGRMNFRAYGGITVQGIYDRILRIKKGRKLQPSTEDIEKARDSMIVQLRDIWHGGMNNAWAQTRLASSYGLLQLTFHTAVTERDYPRSDPNRSPERLNENAIFLPFAMLYLQQLLEATLGTSNSSLGDWPNGFEGTLRPVIRGWNRSRDRYTTRVFDYARDYWPFHN